MPMGRDLGYLPGSIEEKLNPWMQPIFDNLEFLLVAGGAKRRGVRGFDELIESGQVAGGTADLHPRPQPAATVRDRGRGSEPDPARDEDRDHALR